MSLDAAVFRAAAWKPLCLNSRLTGEPGLELRTRQASRKKTRRRKACAFETTPAQPPWTRATWDFSFSKAASSWLPPHSFVSSFFEKYYFKEHFYIYRKIVDIIVPIYLHLLSTTSIGMVPLLHSNYRTNTNTFFKTKNSILFRFLFLPNVLFLLQELTEDAILHLLLCLLGSLWLWQFLQLFSYVMTRQIWEALVRCF